MLTLERLLGRNASLNENIHFDNQMEADQYYVALEMMECCLIARNEGLLAVEEFVKNKNEYDNTFLKFCVEFLMDGCLRKQWAPAEAKEYLLRYAESELEPRTSRMISEIMVLIFSGEKEEIVKENLCSYLGRMYAHLLENGESQKRWKMERDDAIHFYSHYDTGMSDIGILTALLKYDDRCIQRILKCINNEELLNALLGASSDVRTCIMNNLSDRMIILVGEDMMRFSATQEDIVKTKKRLVDLGKEFAI